MTAAIPCPVIARSVSRPRKNGLRSRLNEPKPIRLSNVSSVFVTLLDVQKALIPAPQIVFDVGSQHGDTTKEYVDAFNNASVFGFEPDLRNFAAASALLNGRATLINAAVTDHTGSTVFHLNTHDGTHSILPIGDTRFWLSPASTEGTVIVPCITIDDFCSEQGISRIDILKMDIQGAELMALRGGAALLADRRIGLIATEVSFKPLYAGQPLFDDVRAYLDDCGYVLRGLHDEVTVNGERSWADAVFTPHS
jgi:FkbM family methyltransferase